MLDLSVHIGSSEMTRGEKVTCKPALILPYRPHINGMRRLCRVNIEEKLRFPSIPGSRH